MPINNPLLQQIEQRVSDCNHELLRIAPEISDCDKDNPATNHAPNKSPHNNASALQASRVFALSHIDTALAFLLACHNELSHGGGGEFNARKNVETPAKKKD